MYGGGDFALLLRCIVHRLWGSVLFENGGRRRQSGGEASDG